MTKKGGKKKKGKEGCTRKDGRKEGDWLAFCKQPV